MPTGVEGMGRGLTRVNVSRVSGGTPSPTGPVWHSLHRGRRSSGFAGGTHVAGTTPQPDFDPAEPRAELAPLREVSPGTVFALVDKSRAAGVPVCCSPGAREAGLLSRGLVNVTLSVRDRQAIKAQTTVAHHFAGLWTALVAVRDLTLQQPPGRRSRIPFPAPRPLGPSPDRRWPES